MARDIPPNRQLGGPVRRGKNADHRAARQSPLECSLDGALEKWGSSAELLNARCRYQGLRNTRVDSVLSGCNPAIEPPPILLRTSTVVPSRISGPANWIWRGLTTRPRSPRRLSSPVRCSCRKSSTPRGQGRDRGKHSPHRCSGHRSLLAELRDQSLKTLIGCSSLVRRAL